jgi:hypothetical protein
VETREGSAGMAVGLELQEIQYLSSIEDVDQENDNIDVSIQLQDGRQYGLVVATPNNIFECMANDGNDYFFGTPILFVKVLDRTHIEKAIHALLSEDEGRWLSVYGVLQV